MASLNFDATQVAPDMGFEVLPDGWYDAMIDESEMKPTKDGSGAYLQLRFSIMGGFANGQKVFQRLNLQNANQTAQDIAYKQLSAICHAIGVMQLQDSSQLHGQPMKIKLKIRKDQTGQYGDTNEINGYKNINEQVEMAQRAAPVNAGFAPAAPAPGFGQPVAPVTPAFAAPVNPAPAATPAAQPWQQPNAAQPWQQPAATPAAVAQPAPVQPANPNPAPTPAWAAAPTQPAPAAQPAQPAPVAPAATPAEQQAGQQAQAAVPPWQQ